MNNLSRMRNEVEAAKRAAFNADITSKLGDSIKIPTTPLPEMDEPDWNSEPYGDDETETPESFEADLVACRCSRKTNYDAFFN